MHGYVADVETPSSGMIANWEQFVCTLLQIGMSHTGIYCCTKLKNSNCLLYFIFAQQPIRLLNKLQYTNYVMHALSAFKILYKSTACKMGGKRSNVCLSFTLMAFKGIIHEVDKTHKYYLNIHPPLNK